MLTQQDCLDELHALILRAEVEGFADAQYLLLRFALAHDGPECRSEAMEGLIAALSQDEQVAEEAGVQQAFCAALLTMIERTKVTIGSKALITPSGAQGAISGGQSTARTAQGPSVPRSPRGVGCHLRDPRGCPTGMGRPAIGRAKR